MEGSATRKIAPAIEEERKQVTVLFSDLSGYTAMSERLDPEEVKKIMNRIFGEITATVSKYDGTIQKFIGDAAVAFFGVPKVHEDDPVRAIRAAREIHELVEALSPQFEYTVGKRLAMHSGINTGLVVTGEVTMGNGILGVTGDTVNLAARLSTLARPGEILVGRDTFRRAEGFFNFRPLEPATVKGKVEPVLFYRVAGKKEKPRRSVGVDSPLVGREKEKDLLSLQILRLINGQGGIVTVAGEAGIGKSRLLAELRLTEPVKKTILLEGRALSMGKGLSFYPIIDALKHWSQIRENDTDSEAQWKLERAIRDIHPEEAGEIFPFIATLMGMKLTGKYAQRVKGIEGESLEKLIFKSLRELLIKGSEIRPTVIYMEDFHWADMSSLELLKALFRLVEEYRILFIIVFRPGYTDTGERITAFIRENYPTHWTKIELEPLKESESALLLSNLHRISSFPHPLREQILQRAGGNPFFIEEVVRSLINDGAVVLEKGEYRVTEKIKDIVIPQSIHALIMARIDRLDEETRNLVRVASVIGRNFFYRILTEVTGTIEEIDWRLDHLKEIQLIRERRRMEEVEYLFKHALTQETAYESILIQKRKEIHQKVAQSIERVFNERLHEFYGMLAYHYSRAESLEEAEKYLIKAGEEALKSSASNEALTYYQEALTIYRRLRGDIADPEKIAMLEKNIGLALFNRGHYAEAMEHLDKALNYYWVEFPQNALSTALRFLSSFTAFILALYFPSFWFNRLPTHRDTETVDLFYKKAEALAIIDPKRFFIESIFFHGSIVHFDLTKFTFGVGIFAGASSLFSFTGFSFPIGRRILDYAKPRLAPDDAKQRIVYDLLDTIHHFLKGQWNDITDCNEDLVNRNLRLGEMYYASQHYYWHGLVQIYQGRFDAARLTVSNLSEIAEVYENDISRCLKYLLHISLLIECRLIKEATAEVNRGIDFFQKWGFTLPLMNMHCLKSLTHLLAKETDEAGKSIDRANQIKSDVRAVPVQLSAFYRSQFEYYLCRLADSLRTGHREKSSEMSKKAFKSGKMLIKTCQKAAQYRTESYRLMGLYHWLIHDQKGAYKWWNKAISEGENLSARPQLSRTFAEMGRCLCEGISEPSGSEVRRAKEPLLKAETMFRELGLHQDLEELNWVINQIGLEPSEI
jgi:class 3 adenylate cyclase/tetratricopeptide (TPR) repeat protein